MASGTRACGTDLVARIVLDLICPDEEAEHLGDALADWLVGTRWGKYDWYMNSQLERNRPD